MVIWLVSGNGCAKVFDKYRGSSQCEQEKRIFAKAGH